MSKLATKIPLTGAIVGVKFLDEIERGECMKKKKTRKKKKTDTNEKQEDKNSKKKKKGIFYNQVTLLVRPNEERPKPVNVMVFCNGAIKMTGCTNILETRIVAEIVCNNIRNLHKSLKAENKKIKVVNDLRKFRLMPQTEIIMINSGFEVMKKVVDGDTKKVVNEDYDLEIINKMERQEIDRDKLFQKLRIDYNLTASFDPLRYQAVKVSYFWKKDSSKKDGICHCEKKCNPAGKGDGITKCKKVTIMIFQSGYSMITGGNLPEQIEETYKFITNILRDDIDSIKLDNFKTKLNLSCQGKTEDGASFLNEKNIEALAAMLDA